MSWRLSLDSEGKQRSDSNGSGNASAKKKPRAEEAEGPSDQDVEVGEGVDRKKGADKLKQITERLDLLTKQTLANSQQLRVIMSTLAITCLLPSEHLVAKRAAEAGRKYDEEVKGKKGKHDLLAPHAYVFIEVLAALCEVTGLTEQDSTRIRALLAGLDKAGAKAVMAIVTYCSSKEAYKKPGEKQLTKLCIVFDPLTTLTLDGCELQGSALSSEFKRLCSLALSSIEGAEVKTGQAPRGVMERLLQKQLKGGPSK